MALSVGVDLSDEVVEPGCAILLVKGAISLYLQHIPIGDRNGYRDRLSMAVVEEISVIAVHWEARLVPVVEMQEVDSRRGEFPNIVPPTIVRSP